MTQYTTDFSEYTSDAAPSDWTARNNGADWIVRADAGATGGKVLRQDGVTTTNSRFSLTWNDIDADANRANVEVLAQFEYLESGHALVTLRSGDTNIGYQGGLENSNLVIQRFDGGSTPITLASQAHGFSINDTVRVRFRVNGSSLSIKAWLASASEPGSWDLETTDGTFTAPEHVGVYRFFNTSIDWDWFSVATNGDTAVAPSSGITGSGSHSAATATHSGSGTRTVTGSASHQAATATQSGSGAVSGTVTGSGSHQAQQATQEATGSREVTGTPAHQAATATQTAAGTREITGTGAHNAETATQSGSGAVDSGADITGSGAHQASTAEQTASGTRVVTGSGSHQAGPTKHYSIRFFPTIEDHDSGVDNSNTGISRPVPLPATVNAGDLLLVIMGADGAGLINTGAVAGWTELTESWLGAEQAGISVYYKEADGTEGGTDFPASSGNDRAIAWSVYRISGWQGIEVNTRTDSDGAGTDYDPGSATPSWSRTKNLWIPAVVASDDHTGPESYSSGPTDYTLDANEGTAGADNNNAVLGTAHRFLDAGTEDPGAYSATFTKSWLAHTIAVGPRVIGVGKHQAQTATQFGSWLETHTGSGSHQADRATGSGVGIVNITIDASGSHQANTATSNGSGVVLITITGSGNHQAQTATHSGSGGLPIGTFVENPGVVDETPVYSAVNETPLYSVENIS